MAIFDKKSIPELVARAEEDHETSLRRGLGPFHLTALGVGAIIGAGIFVITGQAAALHAGPAIVLSFVVAGIACAFAAICYSELASMIPVSGSAYTYAYATMGELFAWIVAWALMAEYLFAASAVAVGWSGYFVGLLAEVGIHVPAALREAPLVAGAGHALELTGSIINLPAVCIIFFVASILIAGVGQSAAFNAVIVALKVFVVILVIVFGLMHSNILNWTPFIPPVEIDPVTGASHFGIPGIFAGAGVIFFAYLGFDTVATAAQEAKDPQRTLPIGILLSLLICTVLYILVALAITGMAPFRSLNVAAPIYVAVDIAGPSLAWLKPVVAITATVGLASTLLALLYGQSRIFYSMARDGLLPPIFARVNPKRRTPWAGTLITAIVTSALGGLLPIGLLAELVSVGTLLAFVLICLAVMYLRLREPDLKRGFKTPIWPVTTTLGIVSCLYLISELPSATNIRMLVWIAIGLVVYFIYVHRRGNKTTNLALHPRV